MESNDKEFGKEGEVMMPSGIGDSIDSSEYIYSRTSLLQNSIKSGAGSSGANNSSRKLVFCDEEICRSAKSGASEELNKNSRGETQEIKNGSARTECVFGDREVNQESRSTLESRLQDTRFSTGTQWLTNDIGGNIDILLGTPEPRRTIEEESIRRVVVTPPAVVTAGEAETPDGDQTYTHNSTVDPSLIPKVGMWFDSEDKAYDFFLAYAREVGFGLVKGNKKEFSRVIKCNKCGKGEYFKKDEEMRVRNYTSKKTGCKAQLKLKRVYDENKIELGLRIEQAHLNHNHKFTLSARKLKHQQAHKYKDPVLLEFVDELQACDVPNHCVRNIMREMHGGVENVPMTSREPENRKAMNMREEHSNDIKKTFGLLQRLSGTESTI